MVILKSLIRKLSCYKQGARDIYLQLQGRENTNRLSMFTKEAMDQVVMPVS